VVTKLFHIVEPDVAFFGRKDYQQWRVIERMVRDLDMAVRVVGMPIQREADGLAMSRCEPSSGGGSTAFACD
jgi:pantoate--beta-alanine ligase